MKGRLSSTVWTLVGLEFIVLAVVLILSYGAGVRSPGLSLVDAFSGAGGPRLLLGGVFCVVGAALVLYLGNRVVNAIKEISEFSERLGAGDYRAKLAIDSQDDFGYIAENLTRATEKV